MFHHLEYLIEAGVGCIFMRESYLKCFVTCGYEAGFEDRKNDF